MRLLIFAAFLVTACATSISPSSRPRLVSPTFAGPSISAVSESVAATSARAPSQDEIVGAVARWLTRSDTVRLGPTLFVLTGAGGHNVGFVESEPPLLLTDRSRASLSTELSGDHVVRFIDEEASIRPSPEPDVSISWSYPDMGTVIGLALAADSDATHPSVIVWLSNGAQGTDAEVRVGQAGSTFEVVNVIRASDWIS